MPPFIQVRQPPDDSWITFDLAVPNVIQVRQPPNFEWVPYLVGGGGGLGRFVREFATVAAMAADATLAVGDVCTCIDTTPNRWFNILATADPLIRNVVIDIAGGGGLQAHQVPDSNGLIWFGPARGGVLDDTADIQATLDYCEAHNIIGARGIPSPTWRLALEMVLAFNVELHFNEGDTLNAVLGGGVPFAPSPAIFNATNRPVPGALSQALLPIDPPTNAWVAYEGATTVLVASVLLPSPIVVGDEVHIWSNDNVGSPWSVSSHEVTDIQPSGANFLLTLEPAVPWPMPNTADTGIVVIDRPKNILIDGHGARVTGAANRMVSFAYGLNCKIQNFEVDDLVLLANCIGFDFGCYKCEAEDIRASVTVPSIALAFSIERDHECWMRRCTAKGPWDLGFAMMGYRCGFEDPRAENCANSYRMQDSRRCLLENIYSSSPAVSHFQSTESTVGARNVGNEIHKSEFLRSPVVAQQVIGTTFTDDLAWTGIHKWDAVACAPDDSGGNTAVFTNVSTWVEELILDGTGCTKTRSGLDVEGGTCRIGTFRSSLVGYALFAQNNATIDVKEAYIDTVGVVQPPPNGANSITLFASVGGRIAIERGNITAPNVGAGGIFVGFGGGLLELGDVNFLGNPGSARIVAGTTRLNGRFTSTAGAGCFVAGAEVSRGLVVADGTGNPQAVPFADLTAFEAVVPALVAKAGVPSGEPELVKTAGTGFTWKFGVGDLSSWEYRVG